MFRARISENAHLQLLEERHAATVFTLVDHERTHLREWLPWVDATERVDDTLSFIKSSLEQFASNHGFAAGIWCEDEFCGVVGTHKLDWLNRRGEIGYWLARSHQGRGLITAACRAVVTHLLGDLDLNRAEINCATGNRKSCAVPPRLGFTEEGVAREALLLHGRFHDLRRFAMLKKDWKA